MTERTPEVVQGEIENLVTNNDVVLFMKGNRLFPRCGFSAAVVEVLKRSEVKDYEVVDVLQDPLIRQGIKVYSNWPTLPQLYVRGEFVGGRDIVVEMYEAGELDAVLFPTAG